MMNDSVEINSCVELLAPDAPDVPFCKQEVTTICQARSGHTHCSEVETDCMKILETWLNSGTVVCRNITIKHKPTIYWIANFRFSNISPLTEEPNMALLPQEDIQQADNETRCRFLIEKCSSLEREISMKKKRIAKLSSLHVNEKKTTRDELKQLACRWEDVASQVLSQLQNCTDVEDMSARMILSSMHINPELLHL